MLPGIRGFFLAGGGGGGMGLGVRQVKVNAGLAHSSFSLQAGKLIPFHPVK